MQEVHHRPLLETLGAYLKNKMLLLILDNCEHVIRQAAAVAQSILSTCPQVRILATSRESLRAPGEHSYRLPSLSVPAAKASRRISGISAAAYGAIVLFTDRARAVDHHFTLTNENAPTVAALCRQWDSIPLAIELAAARVNQLSPKALVKKLTIGSVFSPAVSGRPSRGNRRCALRSIGVTVTLRAGAWVFEDFGLRRGLRLVEATTVCADEAVGKDEVFICCRRWSTSRWQWSTSTEVSRAIDS